MKEKKLKVREKGITLIALVITIIILLILAGVTIATLTGDNGILIQANNAKDKTELAEQEEKEDLDATEDLINQYAGIDWDNALENATKHPDQKTSTAIGVGTNGKPVNMDLWEYSYDSVTEGYGLNDSTSLGTSASAEASKGYNPINENYNDINIPQYISADDGKTWTPVTNMDWTFYNCTSLEKIDSIPNTVKSMRYTFRNCSSLKNVGDIPESVINMTATFFSCNKLTQIGRLGNNVKIMVNTFKDCSNLENITNIPNNVEDMSYAFYQCYKIKSIPNIPSTLKNMNTTFYNCTNLKSVPTVPNSVTNMYQTFRGCSNLSGNLEINASVSGKFFDGTRLDYAYCFLDASTAENAKLTLSGDCQILNELLNTKSSNSNISL